MTPVNVLSRASAAYNPAPAQTKAQTTAKTTANRFMKSHCNARLIPAWPPVPSLDVQLLFRHREDSREPRMPLYVDRSDAGRHLVRQLLQYAESPSAVVVALPRGGVPVAAEVARALSLPLDILLVRKLGVPGHEELALGAIASGGAVILNREIVDALGIGDAQIHLAAERENK